MSDIHPPQLQYAPPPRWHQRRRARRIFALLLLLVVLAPAAWNWRSAWRQVR